MVRTRHASSGLGGFCILQLKLASLHSHPIAPRLPFRLSLPAPLQIAAMAMLTLTAASSLSLRLAASATLQRSSPSPASLLGVKATPRMNATSLRLLPALGSFKQPPQQRKWRCEAESVDTNETAAAGEQKVSQVKESLTEKQGPPVLTILAGFVVAVLVIWGLWSLISAILGFFFH